MSPETISERAAAIRLGRKALAGRASLSEKSVGQILNGRSGGQYDSVESIRKAVIAEELRLRDYLLALHPVEAKEGQAA